MVDARGVVTGWSESARSLTGYAAEEIVGRPAVALPAAEEQPGEARRALEAGGGVVAVRHRDGRRMELALRVCPLLGERGRRGFVVTAAPDDQGRLLGEPAFRQASVSMSVFDTEQRYLRMNDVACRVMGVAEPEFRGGFFLDTVENAEYSRGFLRHLSEVARTGRPVRYESCTRAPSGIREHAWNTEMWPLRDASGQVLGTALAAFDSSEQYWARQRPAMLNEAATAIGTTLDVIHTARELAEHVVPRLADFVSVDLLDSVLQGEEPHAGPVGADVELRRVAHHSSTASRTASRTAGVPEAAIDLGAADVYPPFSPPARPPARSPPAVPCSAAWATRRSAYGSRGTVPGPPSWRTSGRRVGAAG